MRLGRSLCDPWLVESMTFPKCKTSCSSLTHCWTHLMSNDLCWSMNNHYCDSLNATPLLIKHGFLKCLEINGVFLKITKQFLWTQKLSSSVVILAQITSLMTPKCARRSLSHSGSPPVLQPEAGSVWQSAGARKSMGKHNIPCVNQNEYLHLL